MKKLLDIVFCLIAISCIVTVMIRFATARHHSIGDKGFIQVSAIDGGRILHQFDRYEKETVEFNRLLSEAAKKYGASGCDVFGEGKDLLVECVK